MILKFIINSKSNHFFLKLHLFLAFRKYNILLKPRVLHLNGKPQTVVDDLLINTLLTPVYGYKVKILYHLSKWRSAMRFFGMCVPCMSSSAPIRPCSGFHGVKVPYRLVETLH